MKLALRPIGNPAPPRPRTLAASSSSITACRSMPSALRSDSYPPARSYSDSFVRSCSSVPARTTEGRSAIAQLPDDRRHLVRTDRLAVAVVDRDDGAPAAAAGALDGAQRHLSVDCRLARAYAQLALEGLEHLLGADEGAGDVRADLDQVPSDGGQVEHVVEGRDGPAVGRRQLERVGDLAEGLGRQPAVALLSEPQRREDRRAALRILVGDRADLLLQSRHRSTSPMTVSSEPTIAIMSAISASFIQVAVASSATRLGARKRTRQGFGPP